jgi:transposase
MITPEMRTAMRRLVLVELWKIETVARRYGVHHSVVRRAVRDDAPADTDIARPSALDAFKPYIVERITEYPELTGLRLYEELRSRGYSLGIAQLRRYLMQVRRPRARKAYLRIETEPGEQAQVDWGSFGAMRAGNAQRPLYAFSMVLSWSRALFVDFSFDMRMETFCAMHRRALEYFQGVPQRILYDNLKSVVLHHIGTTVQFNPRFLLFAGHYLFEPVAAPVRYPEAKGRVEASIKFLRHSFFYGRAFGSLADLRAQAAAWRDQTANVRLHATTRERPADRLLVERTRLRALPGKPFDSDRIESMIVSKEARVPLDTNSYSVPHTWVGKTVHVRANEETVRVVCAGEPEATHARSWDKHRAIEDPAHIEAMIERRPNAAGPKRKDRLASLSPASRIYLQEIARRRINLECEVQKLLRLCTRYGDAEVAAGMAAALAARTFGARFVRTLIDQHRFARGLREPPEPVVTGNPAADAMTVEPHSMETYDALIQDPSAIDTRRAGDAQQPVQQPDGDPHDQRALDDAVSRCRPR